MTDSATVRDVTVGALRDALATGEITLVDVRESIEWSMGRVPGARHLPMSQLQRRYGEIADSGPIHVICQSGSRSARCAAFLAACGYDAANVRGGTSAWVRAGLPLER